MHDTSVDRNGSDVIGRVDDVADRATETGHAGRMTGVGPEGGRWTRVAADRRLTAGPLRASRTVLRPPRSVLAGRR